MLSTSELISTLDELERQSQKGELDRFVEEPIMIAYFDELCDRVIEMEPEAVLWAIERDMRLNFGDGRIRVLCQN